MTNMRGQFSVRNPVTRKMEFHTIEPERDFDGHFDADNVTMEEYVRLRAEGKIPSNTRTTYPTE